MLWTNNLVDGSMDPNKTKGFGDPPRMRDYFGRCPTAWSTMNAYKLACDSLDGWTDRIE